MAVTLLLPVLFLLAGALVLAASRPQRTADQAPGPRLAAVQRRTTRWRWSGVLIGLVLAGVVLFVDDPLGRGVMLAAPLFSVGVLAGVTIGELRVSAPTGPTRRVALEVRTVRDYLPFPLARVVVGATALLGALLALTTAMGAPDDLGRAGRSLVRRCSEVMVEGRGPWPGSFYSVPLAVLVLGGLAAAAFALHRVVRRPRQGEDQTLDDALRRRSAAAVTAATGVLVAIPLAGVSTFAAIALLGVSCPPWWFGPLGWSLVVAVPASLALVVWCTAVLVAPGGDRTRDSVRG